VRIVFPSRLAGKIIRNNVRIGREKFASARNIVSAQNESIPFMAHRIPSIWKDSIRFIVNSLFGGRGVVGSKITLDGLEVKSALGHGLIQITKKAFSIESRVISKFGSRLTVHVPPGFNFGK
jgi:hypothetical protein